MLQNVTLALLSLKRKWYLFSYSLYSIYYTNYKADGFNNGLQADLAAAA